MTEKKIYDIHLYQDGQFEVKDSMHDRMFANDIMIRTCDGRVSTVKQSYEENIEKTKKYLVNDKINDCKKELKDIKARLKIYETAKLSL